MQNEQERRLPTQNRWRPGKRACGKLPRITKRKQWGRKKTSQDIARQNGAVSPRILDPLGHRETREKVRKNLKRRAIRENSNRVTRADKIKKICVSGNTACAEIISSSQDHFGTLSENFGYMEPSKEPQ